MAIPALTNWPKLIASGSLGVEKAISTRKEGSV